MTVAQQFIAGKIEKSGSVPVGTIDNDQYFSAIGREQSCPPWLFLFRKHVVLRTNLTIVPLNRRAKIV